MANTRSELVPSSLPPASTFVLGAIEVALIATAIVILFAFPSSTLVLVLGSIGAAAGVFGLISLIWGNRKRMELIYDAFAFAKEPERASREEGLPSDILLDRYVSALRKIGAYKEAFTIQDIMAGRGSRSTSDSKGHGNEASPA